MRRLQGVILCAWCQKLVGAVDLVIVPTGSGCDPRRHYQLWLRKHRSHFFCEQVLFLAKKGVLTPRKSEGCRRCEENQQRKRVCASLDYTRISGQKR